MEIKKNKMKVKYIGKEYMDYLIPNNRIDLEPNKIYNVLKETKRDYVIIDESGEDYAYPKSFFEIVEE
ncbi:MAG: hypothetical protein ACI3XX_05765 [Eubacteriales bacterium]